MDKGTLSSYIWCLIAVVIIMVIIGYLNDFNTTTKNSLDEMGDNYLAKSELVELPEPSKIDSLNDLSWAQIQKICDENLESTYGFKVGNTKDIELTYSNGNTEKIQIAIMGFDHDRMVNSNSVASITFGFVNCLSQPYCINYDSSNKDGWNYSDLYEAVNSEDNYKSIYNALPKDLQRLITPVYKYSSIGEKNSTIKAYENKLFLFSEEEITGQANLSYNGEGKMYDYFKSCPTVKSPKIGEDAYSVSYWLRSVVKNSDYKICTIDTNGSCSTDSTDSENGIALGFCIK